MAPKLVSLQPTQPSLDTWLSIQTTSPKTAVPRKSSSQTTSPTTPAVASHPTTNTDDLITYSSVILDKDSIFIATAFPLSASPTQSKIQSILNRHLSPPRHDSLPAVTQRGRGINPTHRMWAWRALALKPGTRGTSPHDFVIEEGSEDDDEKYGGDRVLKVLRDLEGVDVLVVCSRWFGGTLLGPIRFQHIEQTATAALKAHLHLADIKPLKLELLARDDRIASLRYMLPTQSTPASTRPRETYATLDSMEKAERLLLAREKLIQALEKKIEELSDGEGLASTCGLNATVTGSALKSAQKCDLESSRQGVKRAVQESLSSNLDGWESHSDGWESHSEEEQCSVPPPVTKRKRVVRECSDDR